MSERPSAPDAAAGGSSTVVSRKRMKSRLATLGVILVVAGAVQWHRSIGLAVAGRWYASKAGGESIGARQAIERIAAEAVLVLDVRERAEYDVSHVPEARWISMATLEQDGLPADWPRDRAVLTYCTIGYRSGVAARVLADQGIDARSIVGGILALAADGQPLTDETGPTRRVHTWKKSFAWMLPRGFEPVFSED